MVNDTIGGFFMEFILNMLKKYWYLFLGGLILIFIILFQLWMFYYFNNKEIISEDKEISTFDTLEKVEDVKDDVVEYLYVDIKGKVKKPGVYKLSVGSRVNDVINAAGGLLGDADTSVTNLSLKIFDEMVIIIYSKDEVNKFKEIKKEESLVIEGCMDEEKIKNDSCVSSSEDDVEKVGEKISINNASIDELMQLPGVGESKAKGIIEYRTKNGNFEKIEDLLNVSGIGEKLFEDIKEYISL